MQLGAYVFRDLIRYQLVQAGITSGISHSTKSVGETRRQRGVGGGVGVIMLYWALAVC